MSDSTDRSPFAKPGFLFSAGFITLIVLMLVGVLLLTGGSGSSGQERPAPPAATTTTSPPTGGQPSTPQQPAGPTTVPRTAPPTTWRLYHTVALPYSNTAGPRRVTPSTATGYVHTPTGALMAAAQIPMRQLLAPDWRAVLDQQVVPGPGRAAFAAARGKAGQVQVQPGRLGQYAGYKFVTYTPHTAVIQLVSRFPQGKLQLSTITVSWRGGDWKLVLQPTGAASPSYQAIDSLVGYVRWGGV